MSPPLGMKTVSSGAKIENLPRNDNKGFYRCENAEANENLGKHVQIMNGKCDIDEMKPTESHLFVVIIMNIQG